jgi:hypothetical protein
MVLFFFKFFFDVLYLSFCIGKKFINRSSSTAFLFWARIVYDLTTMGSVMLFYKFAVETEKTKSVVDISWSYIIIPKGIVEFILFRTSVHRAKARYIYQKHCDWQRG